MGYLFVGETKAMEVDGKSQRDFIDQGKRLEGTLGNTSILRDGKEKEFEIVDGRPSRVHGILEANMEQC